MAAPAPRSLAVVAVCHGVRPRTLAEGLQRVARASGLALEGVLVDNHATGRQDDVGPQFRLLRGSNALLDFSGYFEGLDHLLATRPEAASGNVLFVNDTLLTKHSPDAILRHVLALDALVAQIRVPAMAGKLDPHRSVCLRNPWSGLDRYISSFCFLMNAKGLPAMQGLLADAQADGALLPLPVGDEGWGRGIPAALRELIRAHLVYEGSPYRWSGAAAGDADLLRRKACCVYFESRLSGVIALQGTLLPINAGLRTRCEIALREMAARAARLIRPVA